MRRMIIILSITHQPVNSNFYSIAQLDRARSQYLLIIIIIIVLKLHFGSTNNHSVAQEFLYHPVCPTHAPAIDQLHRLIYTGQEWLRRKKEKTLTCHQSKCDQSLFTGQEEVRARVYAVTTIPNQPPPDTQ